MVVLSSRLAVSCLTGLSSGLASQYFVYTGNVLSSGLATCLTGCFVLWAGTLYILVVCPLGWLFCLLELVTLSLGLVTLSSGAGGYLSILVVFVLWAGCLSLGWLLCPLGWLLCLLGWLLCLLGGLLRLRVVPLSWALNAPNMACNVSRVTQVSHQPQVKH